MKKIFLIAVISCLNLLSISCSTDGNNSFQGNWSGNFNGDEYDVVGTSSNWNGKIDSNGKFTGTVIKSSSDHNYELSGKVDDNGTLVGNMKNTKYNITINIVGTFQNNSGHGTWDFNGSGMSGTWDATKK